MNATSRIAATFAIAAACGTAFAQATTPATPQPEPVATTSETAQAANDKAIKRSDTASVVRTGPTAAERARQLGDRAEAKVDSITTSDGTTIAANDSTRTTSRDAIRAPRADRN